MIRARIEGPEPAPAASDDTYRHRTTVIVTGAFADGQPVLFIRDSTLYGQSSGGHTCALGDALPPRPRIEHDWRVVFDNRAGAKKEGAVAVTDRDRLVARFAAWLALLAAAGVVAALVALVVRNVVTLLLVLAAVCVAAALGWVALTRRGTTRFVAAGLAVAALVGGAVTMIIRGAIDELVVFLVAGVVFAVATRHAIRLSRRQELPSARPPPRPEKAVLLMNPRSGGGKVERFELVLEAKRRGIDPVLLGPGDDLLALAREAARSADVIGMAGGDGSQALVARVAMEHDVAFVCVPAGTRNHLALDLGLDRDDVVGALEAFSSPVEREVDLAFVNDRVFVNNVSLGVYAEIVQSEAYRDAKLGDDGEDAARAARAERHAVRSPLPRP